MYLLRLKHEMKRLKSTSFILSFMLQPFYTNSGSAYQRDNPPTFLQHNTQYNIIHYFTLHCIGNIFPGSILRLFYCPVPNAYQKNLNLNVYYTLLVLKVNTVNSRIFSQCISKIYSKVFTQPIADLLV